MTKWRGWGPLVLDEDFLKVYNYFVPSGTRN